MANILDILTRAQALRQETALNSITPERAGGIMYDTLILINQMQLEGGSLLISKVYSSVAAMEADTTPTSDLTGRALRPGQLAVIVPSSSTSSDMGSEYRFNGPGSWTYIGKVGGLPLDTVPTQSSTKGITSGGVYTALAALKNEGYKYMGLATPGSGGTSPGTPNQPVFYIAGPGSYPNFGSITVASGYLGFIKYSGGSWSVESVAVGKDYDQEISQLQQEVDEKADKGDLSYNKISKGASAFELQGFFATSDTKESNFRTNSSFLSHIFTGLDAGTKIYYDVRVNSNCNRFTAIDSSGNIIDTNVASSGNVFESGFYTVPNNAVKVYLTVRNDESFVADQAYGLQYDLAKDIQETVRFTEQELTAPQRSQARANIGAFGEGDSIFVKVEYGGDTFFNKNGYLAKTDTNISQLHIGTTWFNTRVALKPGDKFDYALSAGGSVMMIAAIGNGGNIIGYVVGAGSGTMSYGTYTVPQNTAYILLTTYENNLSDSYIKVYTYIDEIVATLNGGGVVERNGVPETTNKLMQGKRGLGTSAVKQVSLLQFSDIHANGKALKNVVDFVNYYSQFLDDVIHCGDTVQTYWASDADVAFWDSAGANSILNTIGNHDSATYNGGYDWDGVSEADCYARYLAPYIAGWGVTYTEGKCYYYKDYTGANLRVVVLDEMHYGQEQHDWFVGVLASAKTAGYDVLCVIHSTVLGIVTKVSTFASSEKTSAGIGALSPSPLDAVDTFINDGGHFACWLDGHTHFDDCGYVNGYPNQLHICITTQNYQQAGSGDTDRTVGEKQEDAFNVISVDSATHKLRVFRIGADFDRLLRHKGEMCYDYANNQLIFNG